ncbi:arylesterase [Aliiglaciecola sp. LCG003]|uniref:arylesterase n=1 Tax=Aliiglaciecola sp. LCG003 TaxID=3053655 RepID=UPI002573F640|nr:arylesterase [Aliiglaciecola sp. LCG003]WJG11274.1 arylesterase [Aliiglaciecola sp. LCG003]
MLFIPLLVFSDHLAAEQSEQSEQSEPTKMLVLGDSLSAAYGLKQEQGWVSLLQNAWQDQRIIVVNAAISGETTDGGLARLPRLLAQHSPTHLYIELGGNDGLQGHPVNKMRENLQAMIDLAKQQNVAVIVQQMQIPTNYGRRYNQMFTGMYQALASDNQLPLIPFFMQDIALDNALMQRDGIHPNLDAQPIIANFMQQQLSKILIE